MYLEFYSTLCLLRLVVEVSWTAKCGVDIQEASKQDTLVGLGWERHQTIQTI